MQILLSNIIKQYVPMGNANPQGWHSVLCKVCNDHGNKGKRAAFKFEHDSVLYHCFNCSHVASFDLSNDTRISSKMITVLESFGIPDTEWKQLYLLLNNQKTQPVSRKVEIKEPVEVKLLPFFYELNNDDNDEWCQYAIEYLTERKIDWRKHQFYIANKTNHPQSKYWYGRLIIPIYKNNKLIFYQGRDLTGLHQKRYLSCSTAKDSVLYGYDLLTENQNTPIYITEGWFDAVSINGIAVFGNKMYQQQILQLNRSMRPKIVIPDRSGDGYILAEQAIKLGWGVALPDAPDCKDVNECVIKYGLLYTLQSLKQNTKHFEMAQILVNLYCKQHTTSKYKG